MTPEPGVSVIILNRDRIACLERAVAALRHQSHRDFQLVIVSNQTETVAALFPDRDRITFVSCPAPNISQARNLGLKAASGAIVAFCDDDAVPEPRWLARLVAAFENPQVGAAGGMVRGRNGVSLQWGAVAVDRLGNDHPLDLARNQDIAIYPPNTALVPKTIGTNSAFRRSALAQIGGFDQAFRFFLDETDVNRRLSDGGWHTAIIPLAEVHHGFAASAYRSAERVPRCLFELGASKAYFCTRHGDAAGCADALADFRKAQRARLIRFMLLGYLSRGDIARILSSLDAGVKDGLARQPHTSPSLAPDPVGPLNLGPLNLGPPNLGLPAHRSFVSGPMPEHVLLTADQYSRRRIMAEARDLATTHIVTVLDFDRSTKMTTTRFEMPGFWLHRGGQFGRTNRSDRMVQFKTRRTAIANELARIAPQRPVSDKAFGETVPRVHNSGI